MKNIFDNISKTEVSAILAFMIMLATFVMSFISLLHKALDKDLAILIIGQSYTLAGFVAGYYYTKASSKAIK